MTTVGILGGCAPDRAPEEVQDCPDLSGLTAQAAPQKGDMTPSGQLEQALSLVGIIERRAQGCAEDAGLVWRVVERDGQAYAVTLDYNPLRVNASIRNGRVTAIVFG